MVASLGPTRAHQLDKEGRQGRDDGSDSAPVSGDGLGVWHGLPRGSDATGLQGSGYLSPNAGNPSLTIPVNRA